MMDEAVFLNHIREQAELILSILEGITWDDFAENMLYQYTVVRALEIIGEAAKHISAETRERYLEIPFREMAGLRDRLIHGYFSINPRQVFEIADNDIPELYEQLKKIL